MFESRLHKLLVPGLLLCGLVSIPAESLADNPIVQTNYTADPAPFVYDDTVFVYTSHDEDTTLNDFFTMNDWRCYSTTDMVNWTDHGSPLGYLSFSWSSGDAWAGQVIQRNGQFYYYVPLTSASLNRHVIGVAVSDSPTGPFEDALGAPLLAETGADIDPTVFIDDDGQAYLYWGNPDLLYVRLNEDMISYTGEIERVPMTTESFGTRDDGADRPTSYTEGPWFYRRDDMYYMLFAAECCTSPEDIDYSTSPGPTGPWTYRGQIMDSSASASFTNHSGIVDFRGHSYFFYHNGALPGGGGFLRSVAVEEFTYNADGTIPAIPMTSDGPGGLETLNPFRQTEAETIAFSVGLKTEPCSEGGMNVTAINDADYIKVKDVNFGRGITSFEARVASDGSEGNVELLLDSPTGSPIAVCPIPASGGSQVWQTRTCSVTGATGVRDLFLRFSGGNGADLFNFNWWKFSGPGEADNLPDGGATDSGSDDTGSTGTSGGMGTTDATGTGGTSTTSTSAGTTGATYETSNAGGGGSSGDETAAANNTGNGGCACQSANRRGDGPWLLLLLWTFFFQRRSIMPTWNRRERA